MPELDFEAENATDHDAPAGWFREMPDSLLAVQGWLEELASRGTAWSY